MVEEPDTTRALLQLAYAEMRAMADRLVRSAGDGGRISPSSLVHLASMRLLDQRMPVRDARHMLGLAVMTMRRVLVDEARARKAARRGGGAVLALEDFPELADEPRFAQAIELDEALARLATAHPRPAEVVQARIFAGLSVEQAADLLGLSLSQVKRDWQEAVGWLRRHWSTGG